MAMKTTIIRSGANCPPGDAPAPCAIASGIKPFMKSPWVKALIRLTNPGGPGREGAALCHSVRRGLGRFETGPIAPGESRKTALPDGGTDGPHQVQIEVQVVDGVQPRAQNLIATVEVAKIRARVVAAGVAAARRVQRTEIGVM